MTPPAVQPAPELFDAVVIGAGIAGLTAAFRLHRAGLRVLVLEGSDRVGGAISSASVDGHLFERGPTTVLSTAPRLAALIDDAGLRSEAVESRSLAGRRLVWRRGRLHALPEKPPQLLRCTALSPWGRARLLLEPLVPGRSSHESETLGQFFRRRLGREATAALADPFVTGVVAGDLDALGVDAFPRLAQLERDHGSLLRGLVRGRKAQKAQAAAEGRTLPSGPPPLISFAGGLEHLPRALAEIVARPAPHNPGSTVRTGCRAETLTRLADPDGSQSWQIRARTREGEELVARATRLVIATPAAAASTLLRNALSAPGGADAVDQLGEIHHPAMATVGLGYDRSDIDHPLDAFGLLVASDSQLEDDVLGVLFVSSIFEGRAPDGAVTLTVMIGGSRDPSAAELDDGALVDRAHGALRRLVGARGRPTTSLVSRWPRAIPQYAPGHGARIADLRRRLDPLPGLAVAGNWLDGVGLEAAVASGDRAAERLGAAPPRATAHPIS